MKMLTDCQKALSEQQGAALMIVLKFVLILDPETYKVNLLEADLNSGMKQQHLKCHNCVSGSPVPRKN